jgi:hypothetical protein
MQTLNGNQNQKQNRLLIHDLDAFSAKGLLTQVAEDILVIEAKPDAGGCVGCFGCWIRTPGRCVKKDGVSEIPARIGRCRELILLSRLTFGGLSPSVKAVMDRSIPGLLPFFTIVNGKSRHASRYNRTEPFHLSYYFYAPERGDGISIDGQSDRPLHSGVKSYINLPDGQATDHRFELETGLMARLVEANGKNMGAASWKAVYIGDKMNLPEVVF